MVRDQQRHMEQCKRLYIQSKLNQMVTGHSKQYKAVMHMHTFMLGGIVRQPSAAAGLLVHFSY